MCYIEEREWYKIGMNYLSRDYSLRNSRKHSTFEQATELSPKEKAMWFERKNSNVNFGEAAVENVLS
jgi:hypothetical protein